MKHGVAEFLDVARESLLLANGSNEAIEIILRTFRRPNSRIVTGQSSFIIYKHAATAAHYEVDEVPHAGLHLDLDAMLAAIGENTRFVFIANPNNPTGALYPVELLREIVEIARAHQLIVYADEIYDKVLYDGAHHTSIASLADDVFFVTFNGLSKNYRAAGFRAGWAIVSGEKRHARDYIEGLDILASMRLCANVPAQYGIQTALGGYQSIDDLVAPGGRLGRQRDLAWGLLAELPGVSCVKPQAAMYLFPRLDPEMYPIADDQQFILDLLIEEKVLVVQGTGFNWPHPDHLRIVFLPAADDLTEAIGRFARFLERYRREHGA